MSFYEGMKHPCPPVYNPWSTMKNGCLQSSQPPCAQDASFHSAFAMNPLATLPAQQWPSLKNWVAHQKQNKLKESKRQLAYQLYRIIDVEDLRAAALRQMYIEEEGESQQQQQQQSNGFNGFSYHPAQTAHEQSGLDAHHDEPMHTDLHTIPAHPFVVYRDDTFKNGPVQADVEEAVSPIEECYSNGQKQQDGALDHTRLMSSSETAKAQAAERMKGLAAYVADLKAQMAEKMNSGEFPMDASTARGYEQYSRTPEFLRARRNEKSQNHLSSAEHSQAKETLEGSGEQMPNHSTSSGDSRTPDLYSDPQDQSVDSISSLERTPDEPIFRSPDGPALKILAPQPTPPKSAILQMAFDETAEGNYLYHDYRVDGAEALHWQLPDWLWYHKSQQGGVGDGISYNFNYPPRGYAATPEFVELHYAGELGNPASAEHGYKAGPMEEEISEDGSSPCLVPSEYRCGCTPLYFLDSQSPLYSKGLEDVIRENHKMSTIPEPLADPHEVLKAGIYGIPPAYKCGPILPPTDTLEPSIYEPFVSEPASGLNIVESETSMTDKASKPADLSPTVYDSPPRATPQRQEPRLTENFSSSLTPPNRFRHPVDSDPLTPASPVFQKSTFPNPGQFDVNNTNTEHFFTPSPPKPGSSPPRFVLHTRKSNRNKNREEVKVQPIEAVKARREAVSAYLGIQPSEWPVVPAWPMPGPETPQPSSPFPYSVDTPSPSVLVHKRHLKNRRAKLPAKQPAIPAGAGTKGRRPAHAKAQQYWH